MTVAWLVALSALLALMIFPGHNLTHMNAYVCTGDTLTSFVLRVNGHVVHNMSSVQPRQRVVALQLPPHSYGFFTVDL